MMRVPFKQAEGNGEADVAACERTISSHMDRNATAVVASSKRRMRMLIIERNRRRRHSAAQLAGLVKDSHLPVRGFFDAMKRRGNAHLRGWRSSRSWDRRPCVGPAGALVDAILTGALRLYTASFYVRRSAADRPKLCSASSIDTDRSRRYTRKVLTAVRNDHFKIEIVPQRQGCLGLTKPPQSLPQ